MNLVNLLYNSLLKELEFLWCIWGFYLALGEGSAGPESRRGTELGGQRTRYDSEAGPMYVTCAALEFHTRLMNHN